MALLIQRATRLAWSQLNAYKPTTATCRFLQTSRNKQTQSEEVILKHYSGIKVVGLNRVQSKNALSCSLVEGLTEIVDNLKCDNEARVVILRSSAPGAFCAGADLKERKGMTDEQVKKFVNELRSLFTKIEQLPMPVIAAIDGIALGGGLEMALACDIRVCATNAKLGLVETRLGIIPGAGGTQRLSRLIGPALAKELIFTGRIIDGADAEQYNIVTHLVEQNPNSSDAAYQRAMSLAEEIQLNGPLAVRMAKLAIDKGLQVDLKTGYQIEEACYAQVIPTKDRLEGLQAFAEKRKPIFRGE